MDDTIFDALTRAAMAGVRSLRSRSKMEPERLKILAINVATEAARLLVDANGTEDDWKNLVQAAWREANPPAVEVKVTEKK